MWEQTGKGIMRFTRCVHSRSWRLGRHAPRWCSNHALKPSNSRCATPLLQVCCWSILGMQPSIEGHAPPAAAGRCVPCTDTQQHDAGQQGQEDGNITSDSLLGSILPSGMTCCMCAAQVALHWHRRGRQPARIDTRRSSQQRASGVRTHPWARAHRAWVYGSLGGGQLLRITHMSSAASKGRNLHAAGGAPRVCDWLRSPARLVHAQMCSGLRNTCSGGTPGTLDRQWEQAGQLQMREQQQPAGRWGLTRGFGSG